MTPRPGAPGRLLSVFCTSERIDRTILAAFLCLHAVLLFNAVVQPPTLQYDGEGHLQYMLTLSDGRFPAAADTKEFFSPPLPYLLPALVHGVAGVEPESAMKVGQVANVLVSAGLVWFLLAMCELARPGRRELRLAVIAALALFPVYFRTFSMVRGEPFVALFTMAAAYCAAVLVTSQSSGPSARTTRYAVGLGAALGLAALSRQWGFFLIPAVTVLFAVAARAIPAQRAALARALVLAGTVTVLVGAWYYAGLYHRFGTVTAFNRGAQSFHFYNQPHEFYLGTGSGRLFRDPIRPSFPNQLIPIFYADTWGDYWGFFLVNAVDTRSGESIRPASLSELQSADRLPDWLRTNRRTVARYLAHVNLVALLPSAFALAALLVGALATKRLATGAAEGAPEGTATAVSATLALIVVCSALGYFWFVVKYPILGKGDTVKASYMLHAFPCAAMLMAMLADTVWTRSRKSRPVLVVATGLVLLHNLPALLSRQF